MVAMLALGCSNNSNEQGEPVAVDFGDGDTTINLQGLSIQQTETGGTTITADVVSNLTADGVYTFQATIESAGVFEAVLHNDADISHSMKMNDQEVKIEFLRPTWERSESIGFISAEVMNQWLQVRIDDGSANCAELPARFQDMPLQYATTSILGYLASAHGVAVDLARMQQVLCAIGADEPESNGLGYPVGLAGWDALRHGEYLPTRLATEQSPAAASNFRSVEEKNNCPREIKETTVTGTYESNTIGNATTNINVSCNEASASVDSNCCVDEELQTKNSGTLRTAAVLAHRTCSGVTDASGAATQYADFRFAANAQICPTAVNSCWGNGVRDRTTSYNCEFSGFNKQTELPFDPKIGDSLERLRSSISAWDYLQFTVKACYAPGADEDTIYSHITSVDSNRPAALLCRPEDLQECFCGINF
jgi:hypothetical protein